MFTLTTHCGLCGDVLSRPRAASVEELTSLAESAATKCITCKSVHEKLYKHDNLLLRVENEMGKEHAVSLAVSLTNATRSACEAWIDSI